MVLIYLISGLDPIRLVSPRVYYDFCSSSSLDNELPRFIHHLGPKYAANFQSDELIKQLTYEASTSLNIHLFNLGPQTASSGLLKVLKSGVGFSEDSIVFMLKPSVLSEGDGKFPDSLQDEPSQAPASKWKKQGDTAKVESHGFDHAVWKLGGAAVYLRLVQLASVSPFILGVSSIITSPLSRTPTSYPALWES